ncbi:extensin-like domain-containing protein [Yoonia sp. 208BN28-4]|uniref:extensin-like domain-containing protein n=1 Tax=Yoonia sp. 208BN28-4 TaxID=3126505 RepID=UPI0030A561C2
MAGIVGTALVLVDDTPLPPEWNPTVPLQVEHDLSPLTSWKLANAERSLESCVAALADGAVPRDDFEVSANCHIRDRVNLQTVGASDIADVETTCSIALRMAMWEQHGLQPAAREILNTDLTRIDQIGSYNCRQMRTTSGNSARWSTHATASAIDISGFRFADGTRLRLIDDWNGAPAAAAFLRRARDTSCDWFRLTLSPDYNRLHADHFHLQSAGWGLCR